MLIKWKDEYNLGIKQIDEQHKNLVSVMNNLYEIINEEFGLDGTKKIFEELKKYSEQHFSLEEKYFDEFGFKNAEHHKQHHRFFREKIIELSEEGRLEQIPACFSLIDFLEDWFLNHVTNEDREYVSLFKEHGIK